ncbi:restriction endonuclease subunit S [Nostoc sp. DedQUE09]|uniref:restriction endonuclease subunit S n=1 Tax=Nostoc sp. DedQUE09 TaxID=3075394 RepID=UPI002AD55A6C|nr:restriction endonuclease subunit S [Nostoc sp. DedQUE09]MDZ7953286.1 restriction endonuclease subunit S [Nostoc sp. DedQUE09]
MAKELFDQFRQVTNFPENWKLVELNELIYDLRGGSPLEPEDFLDKGFPVLHKGAIKPFGEIEIDPKKKAFTHRDFVKKYSKSVISREYTTVTLRDLIPSGPSIGLISTLYSSPYPEYILAQGAYAFLVNTKLVIPEYLVWLSNTYDYRKFVRTIAVGSTQIHVRTPVFTSIPIPLPPLAEQKRISAILGKCDRLRRTRRYARQLSDTFLQSVFLEMIGNPFTNPKKWKQLSIREIADIIVPTRDKAKHFCGNVPWITLPDLNGLFINSAKNLLTHEDAAEVGNRLMPAKTVLLSCAGSLGKVAVTTREVYANQQFYGLVAKSSLVNHLFLAISLIMLGEDFFFQLAGISTIGFFSKDKALEIKILLPPLYLQEKFAQIIQKFERLRTQQQEGERQAEHLFQTMLHQAFRGELTSSDFNDETVSVFSQEIPVRQPKPKSTVEVAEYVHTKVNQQETEAVQLTLPGLE